MSFISPPANLGETILWGKKQIEWSDFKGVSFSFKGDAVTSAVLHMEIQEADSGKIFIKVSTMFRKSASSVKKETDMLLFHERGHFDIAEIFARKLRSELSKAYFNSDFQDAIIRLYNINNNRMDLYQDLYDKDTDFSRNTDKQRKWSLRILDELSALATYAHPEIVTEWSDY